tara:strand:- start:1762 stop:2196 length:435 start_codon:yes stop_codon:yes gene_type:complete
MARYKDVKPGLNDVSSYQSSGQPFVSGNIDTTIGGGGGVVVRFPAVTQWVKIINRGNFQAVTCAFSERGLSGAAASPSSTYNFKIPDGLGTDPAHHQILLNVKITELWMKGSDSVDVIAGLTYIATGSAATAAGNSWSGSVGVG